MSGPRTVDPEHEVTRQEINRRLTDALAPVELSVEDHSWKHVGHAGAASGGGHFHVTIVTEAFAGKPLLERHRAINEALADLFGPKIHALKLSTRAPGEGR